MEFSWINDLSKEFFGIGRAPLPQEIIAMKSSVPILAEKQNHDLYHFWGKITGTSRSYLIIVCYTGGLLGEKTYYASLDAVSWFGLPLVTKELLFHTSHIRKPITGNPLSKELVYHPRRPIPFKDITPLIPPKPRNEEEEEEEQVEEKATEEEEDQEEEDLLEFEEIQISEDQRIACLVHLIDKNGLIFPQDSLIWKSANSVAFNPLFKGVSSDATLDDFCRLQKSASREGIRPNAIVESMPLLSDDLPSRGWSISSEKYSNVTKITSKLWPGLCFISKGPHWGTVYLGNGKRNTDFLFASE
ncbi:radial spoke head protein 9 [Histomonas meleagridis]|uniref:radial spoke head protein 9-like n=1 Tax=Histomonas meleagridis TaxID=135588 RepID=UPI0035599453|nr:radial spoke head protein 9 [Histomonas meleagridis]KAH0797249.1 radial spoke head protein 9-like [Histomonas meleagridis]